MLKVTIYCGKLAARSAQNQLATVDIAYARRDALADYLVALNQRSMGERAPNVVKSYPRWSASLWDLGARALARVLYDADEVPSSGTPDRRCAYATRVCASIERMLAGDRGAELATAEIFQTGKQRGVYTAVFEEDILGARTSEFVFGRKALDPVELLLRAICWTYYGTDTLGPRPALAVPLTVKVEGEDRFDVAALPEPARTGFTRYMVEARPEGLEPFARADDYVRFLMQA
jgi:hypothetical protein